MLEVLYMFFRKIYNFHCGFFCSCAREKKRIFAVLARPAPCTSCIFSRFIDLCEGCEAGVAYVIVC